MTTEHRKKYQSDWLLRKIAERKAKYMRPCSVCGSEENIQLHHKDPATKESHKIWAWPIERFEVEFAKCEWLCRRCHWDKHTCEGGSRASKAVCGTTTMYRRGCRCELCKEAKRHEPKGVKG